ncbi:MAG: diaminopimelate decarboxylase, partial [Candidatus Binatota bacterium]
MDYFEYRNGELFAEGVPVRRIALEVGTPAYIYSLATLKRHYRVFDQAFVRLSHLVCFSMKSNSNLAVLRAFVKEGGGFDIVSAGELFRALKAGADPKKIVFSGVGKKKAEIEYALNAGILMFNVESEQELTVLNEIARGMEKKAPISLRVNPDVDPKTHPYISTGMKKSKFGIDIKRSLEVYKRALTLAHLEVIGVDCHIGSQLTTIPPFVDALSRVKVFVEALRKEGARIRYLDLGGGLGIRYKDEEPPHPEEYAGALIQGLRGLDVTLILEPGRVIVGNAGILVTEVLYLKEGEEKTFVVVDGGMNDLIRPALYGSYQAIRPVVERKGEMIVA